MSGGVAESVGHVTRPQPITSFYINTGATIAVSSGDCNQIYTEAENRVMGNPKFFFKTEKPVFSCLHRTIPNVLRRKS